MAVGGESTAILFKKGENMNLGIKLNLRAIYNHTFTSTEVLRFDDISNLTNYAYEDVEDVRRIKITVTSTSKKLEIYTTSLVTPSRTLNDADIQLVSEDLKTITFNCSLGNASIDILMSWINLGLIEVNQFDKTTIFCYRLNDEKEKLSKTLTFVDTIEGKFTAPLGIKSLELDVVDYNIDNSYNYVYIPRLNRYYYITNIVLTTKNHTKLILQEDVLTSWKDLIYSQVGYVSRNENITDYKIVDEREPLESIKTIEYEVLDNTLPLDSKVNITLKGTFANTDYNILVSCYNDVYYTKEDVNSPDTLLPNLSPVQSGCQTTYFLTLDLFDSFTKALLDQDNFVSALNSVLYLPFDPTTPFNTGITGQALAIGLPNAEVLCSDDKFHDLNSIPSGVTTRQVRRTKYGTSPYLVLADFTFPNIDDDWYKHEPYTTYEIYVAFVGWVKIDSSQVSNNRLLIYYTLDYQTGNGTAYIYNKTRGKIIYSCSCQLGVKLDIITSNALELARERQSSELNTLIGLLASAVSVGVGVVSENPVAMVGGVLSAGKTIATAVNSERMRFERAQVSYGSGDSGLHSNLISLLRKTTNTRILSGDNYTNYKHIQGLPCNMYGKLSNFSGYTEVVDIHFDFGNENIYNDEVTEIIALLKNGVIL